MCGEGAQGTFVECAVCVHVGKYQVIGVWDIAKHKKLDDDDFYCLQLFLLFSAVKIMILKEKTLNWFFDVFIAL